MLSEPRPRLLAIIALLVVLGGLFVWAGTIEPDPADNNYPNEEQIANDPAAYLDERVSIGGTVVHTNPLTIESEGMTFVIENADPDVSAGDHLSVFGTYQADNHVDTITVVHREPWEASYMYLVSFGAGLWVLGRLLNGWTLDTTAWTIVPRTEPLVTLWK